MGLPLPVMRDTTELPKKVSAGTLKLVETDEEIIYENCRLLLSDSDEYERMSKVSNPYGDGIACIQITDIILNYFKR